ncbi:hypothetical protein [Microtetraspora fusca]|nr:hypothetical protein [Microtetraspora fusca]
MEDHHRALIGRMIERLDLYASGGTLVEHALTMIAVPHARA